jgi:hypothetical protein
MPDLTAHQPRTINQLNNLHGEHRSVLAYGKRQHSGGNIFLSEMLVQINTGIFSASAEDLNG